MGGLLVARMNLLIDFKSARQVCARFDLRGLSLEQAVSKHGAAKSNSQRDPHLTKIIVF